MDSLKGILKQTYEKAEECIRTNYYGTQRVTQSLLPLLQLSHSPRIMNVSSRRGQLKVNKLTGLPSFTLGIYFLKKKKRPPRNLSSLHLLVSEYQQ